MISNILKLPGIIPGSFFYLKPFFYTQISQEAKTQKDYSFIPGHQFLFDLDHLWDQFSRGNHSGSFKQIKFIVQFF